MSVNLEDVKQSVINCTSCDLCKTRTNAVPGKGNLNSDVIFVGEAPGRNEDIKGEPFVGFAGKRLDNALENIGISRDTVYITNVVKCRPPNNRVPSIKEKESCHEYLQKEIAIIKPKIICILGNTAFNSILGGSQITKFRGKFLRKNSQIYFITIHPAATIYNQQLIPTLQEDMKKLFCKIQNLKDGIENNEDVEEVP